MKIGGPARTSLLSPTDLNARLTTRAVDISAIKPGAGPKERTFWSGTLISSDFVAN
jgi:hypothetical protein